MMQALTEWTLDCAAKVLACDSPSVDAVFARVSTDTRSIEKGDLFVALVGENFDGHDYLAQAKESGAVGAVVSRDVDVVLAQLRVADTRIALGRLAAAHRKNFKKPVIGLTGSNGKTTVKELLHAILERCGKVLATAGNFNNDIGLPLTLLRLALDEDYAVIEMGANHPGEIAYLSEITAADVVILNNAGAAHLEGFGSLEGVARAKGEIFETLSSAGTAVINLDDTFADYWQGITEHCQRKSFAIENTAADVRATNIHTDTKGSSFVLHIGEESVEVSLPLFGRHNVMNALAASAAASVVGIDIKTISTALSSFKAVHGRLESVRAKNGCLVFDDTYNANPSSLRAGIDVLVSLPGPSVLVMGDMLESGKDAAQMHFDAGVYAREKGVKYLFAFGDDSREAVKAFGQGAWHFQDHVSLAGALEEKLTADTTVLVKGSRGMRMEKVVEQLVAGSEE